MKRKIPLLLFSFVATTIFAQNTLNQVLDSYENYFNLPRETLFVHTNKTAYLPGEIIWFTAYLYDRKGSVPISEDTNLICALFDETGKIIEDMMINVVNGIGSGHIELSSAIQGERIFLKARTTWMKNFKEDDSFTAPLELVGAYRETVQHSQSEAVAFENSIELMPEGGHLVANTVNTIGLKLVNLQKSDTPKTLSLLSKDGAVLVQSIQTNKEGIGKFEFIPLSNQEYFVEGEGKNGKKMWAKLGKAEAQGVTLSVNNLFDDKVAILLKTNERTLDHIRGKDYFVAIHRDGILTLNAFQFNDSEHSILVSKDKLLKGMNIITVFDHNLNPILERLIFNETNLNTTRASISKIPDFGKKDSVGLKINLFSKTQAKARLSVSVLPEEAESMYPDQSIISAFLIQPYIKGPIRNVTEYLKNLDRIKKYELDNLLLTQGWSRYDWSGIFGEPPVQSFPYEHGFQLRGKVLNAEAGKDRFLAIYQKSHPQVYQAEVDNNKEFQIKNIVLHKGEEVFATLLNKRNKTEEPKITAEITAPHEDSKMTLSEVFLNTQTRGTIGNKEEEEYLLSDQDFFIDDKIIPLKGVTVTEEKFEKKLVHKPVGVSEAIFDGLKITEDEVKKRPTLQLVLQNLGYRTMISPLGEGIILPKPGAPNIGAPIVIIDGIEMFNPSRNIFNLPPNLLNSNSAGIDEIYYTHQPIEMGNRPVIYIYRKYGSYVGEKTKERFASFMATQGFQRPKEFYNPQYASVSTQKFRSYGTLHWENQLNTDENGEAKFMVPCLEQNGAKVYVEGFTEDGALISEYQIITFE
ncbi:hypothetical protein [Flagellimonas meishanensis]|uniref:hypothetical protein n=1 Tax=Flagellimonas meishanensis TaxID=2873264 RepID=UPI001CA76668|nr:hypothetical protein [[Muricauda] meishanensis]